MKIAQCYNAKKKLELYSYIPFWVFFFLAFIVYASFFLSFGASFVCMMGWVCCFISFCTSSHVMSVCTTLVITMSLLLIQSQWRTHTHTPKSISINRIVGCRHRHHCLAMATIRLHRWIRIVIVWLHIISSFPQHLAISFSLILALSLNPIRYTINIRNMKHELDCWSYAVRTLSNKKQNIKIQ